MKVREFIENYNRSTKKDSFIKRHIIKEYLPYETKVALCESIINAANYKKVNDKRIYWVNSVLVYEFYFITLIKQYTDIEFENDLEGFNLIHAAGLSGEIIDSIADAKSFETVLNMVADDAERNNSLVPFLDTKIDTLMKIMESIKELEDK